MVYDGKNIESMREIIDVALSLPKNELSDFVRAYYSVNKDMRKSNMFYMAGYYSIEIRNTILDIFNIDESKMILDSDKNMFIESEDE